MSTKTLRRAAALMRERAKAATPGPWEFDPEDMDPGVWSDAGDTGAWVVGEFYVREHDAAHIASWHPTVALAVADWLDEAADHLELHSDGLDPALHPHVCPTAIEGLECSVLGQALTVARAYLGEDA